MSLNLTNFLTNFLTNCLTSFLTILLTIFFDDAQLIVSVAHSEVFSAQLGLAVSGTGQ